MKTNKALLGALLIGTSVISATGYTKGTHEVYAEVGALDFEWKEFKEEKDSKNKRTVVIEDGALQAFSAGYAYREDNENIAINFKHATDTIDYLGEDNDGAKGILLPSNVEYSLNTIEAEYGSWFNVDYIKPYAAIFGGYHTRDRNILPFEGSTARLDETISFYYWGSKLEAELFNIQGFSLDIGGQFRLSTKGKNKIKKSSNLNKIDSNFAGTANLKQIREIGYFIRFNYAFLESWKATLKYEYSKARMNQGNVTNIDLGEVAGVQTFTPIFQPKSEQETALVSLRITKSF